MTSQTTNQQLEFLEQVKSATLKDAQKLVVDAMATDDVRLIRGLLLVYGNQTADEQRSESTKHDNGRGFSGTDAQFLSSLAKQAQRWLNTPASARRFDQPLSKKQMSFARRTMKKYAMQIVRTLRGELD